LWSPSRRYLPNPQYCCSSISHIKLDFFFYKCCLSTIWLLHLEGLPWFDCSRSLSWRFGKSFKIVSKLSSWVYWALTYVNCYTRSLNSWKWCLILTLLHIVIDMLLSYMTFIHYILCLVDLLKPYPILIRSGGISCTTKMNIFGIVQYYHLSYSILVLLIWDGTWTTHQWICCCSIISNYWLRFEFNFDT
jgi:hypothetical protein